MLKFHFEKFENEKFHQKIFLKYIDIFYKLKENLLYSEIHYQKLFMVTKINEGPFFNKTLLFK